MFLRSCFKEQIECANNLKETYDAFKAGNIEKLKECRNSFAKGTVKCAAVVGLNTIASKAISSALSGTPLAAVYHAVDEIFDDKLNIATAVVNGLAAATLTAYTGLVDAKEDSDIDDASKIEIEFNFSVRCNESELAEVRRQIELRLS